MSVTGKHTQYAIESCFLVPEGRLGKFIPAGASPYSRFGLGAVVFGAWNHSDAYVDDRSYGPVLEAWVAIGVDRGGLLCGYTHVTYNDSVSYAEPVNNIFKFSKEYADIKWNITDGRHEVEISKDGRIVMRIAGRPTFIPKSVPYSRPRLCWLIKGQDRYIARMSISAPKSRLALCSIDVPRDSHLREIADSTRWYSVFYEDAKIEIQEPEKVQ